MRNGDGGDGHLGERSEEEPYEKKRGRTELEGRYVIKLGGGGRGENGQKPAGRQAGNGGGRSGKNTHRKSHSVKTAKEQAARTKVACARKTNESVGES